MRLSARMPGAQDLESPVFGTEVPESQERALVAARAALSKLGTDIVVLEVGAIIAIIESFVLVSASNTRMVLSIVDEVEAALRTHDGSRPLSTEGRSDASWVLVDYGDVVVHVFLEETRAYYDLDRLWSDAPRLEVVDDYQQPSVTGS
jgi:ribosome-associated protein